MTDDRPPSTRPTLARFKIIVVGAPTILHSAFAVLIVGGVLTWLLVTGKIREMVRRGRG